jgi:proton-dependent oligopeptide transporter, POT family
MEDMSSVTLNPTAVVEAGTANIVTPTTAEATANLGMLARLKQHPVGFWYIFWGELSERASFYGMRTLLALFLLDVLKFDRGHAGQTVEFFVAACYIAPLLGGFIADHYLGKFKTIIYFSIPYIAGHIVLGNSRTPEWLYIALGLLAMGSGTVKPNISPLMAMMYEKAGKKHLLTEAFSYFYASINIGAFATSFALPMLRDRYGYTFALIFPTVLMAVATGIFYIGKKHYPKENIKDQPKKTLEQKREERETLVRISGVFAMIVAFWVVYDQSASTWVFFAKDHMNLTLWPFNYQMTPDQVQALNPLFIVVLTPLFIWMWNAMKQRTGREVPATRKMMLGFVITFACMAAMSGAGFLAGAGKVSVWWEVIATFIITVSELCVSVVGLEMAYSVAPDHAKSTVTAAFLFTVFLGDMVGGFLAGKYESMTPGVYFGLQAGIVFVATILFYFIGKKFERQQIA